MAAIDRAYTAWIRSRPSDAEFFNGIINGTGAFGQFLVDREGLCWVRANDKYGSELAVLRQGAALPDQLLLRSVG